MTPAIAYGAAVFIGMLIGSLFPLVGTAIISVALSCLLFQLVISLL
jgi:hypothetical protein